MTGGLPSSSAQALVVVERDASARGLRTSFDDLDDDDYAAIGRAFAGASPRLALSGMGAVLGAGAGVALTTVSAVAGSAVVIGVVSLAFVVGRRDLRARLVEHGLSPELVEAIFRASWTEQRRARSCNPPADRWRLVWRTEDWVRVGRICAEAARADRDRER